jgi:dTDP-glucose pyrophosphorylase
MIVLDGNKFESVISIGDIQRAIIKNMDLNSPIIHILRSKISFASTHDDLSIVKELMRTRRNELMPVVSPEGELADVIFWEDLFKEERSQEHKIKLDLPVIIMAGGKGSRLKPLTNVLPKPLVPINSKTIIEDIMDRFLVCGCHNFFISVNYKANMIQHYFESLHNTDYQIDYFQEDKPLGTAGSLYLLKNKIHSTFFVTNCDIIIDQDYAEILNYHRENKNEITIVAAIKSYPIPYGTLSTLEDGLLESIQEKPEYIFKINTGFYILEPQLLDEIKPNQFYHITTLIEKLQEEKRRVGVFPVSNGSWVDIGNWKEYLSYINVNNE